MYVDKGTAVPSACTIAQGFDEYMNLVLDEAEELSVKRKTRKPLGRILLKGETITLLQAAYVPARAETFHSPPHRPK